MVQKFSCLTLQALKPTKFFKEFLNFLANFYCHSQSLAISNEIPKKPQLATQTSNISPIYSFEMQCIVRREKLFS